MMTDPKPKLIVDPPQGWRYGFPKPYCPSENQTYADWLVMQGYPLDMVELAMKYSRMWTEQ